MKTFRLLLPSIICTALLAAWFLPQSVRFLPLARAEVRSALVRSLDALDARGIWLVNVAFDGVTEQGDALCMRWVHRYRGRILHSSSDIITVCP